MSIAKCFAGFVVLIIICLWWSGCFPAKGLFLGSPDYKDSNRFPKAEIAKSPSPFRFHESEQDWSRKIMVNDWTTDSPVFKPIEKLAEGHNTQAILIIRNDTILLEYYKGTTDADALHPSYSMAKSFTSALIGVAIREGHITSVNDKVKDYIPELDFHPYFNELNIKHLMNHTSGIKYDLPVDATIYYGKDIWKGIRKIDFDHKPGVKQHYVNVNSQLLGIILMRATGLKPSAYLEEKLWKPLGMESNAFWSTDKKNDLEKTYCCLNATARDYAKLGRLYLNNGNWEGEQIVDAAWVAESVARDTSEGSSYGYNYCWHIGLKEYNDYMADGLYKQHIYVNPAKNLIIVTLNRKEDKLKAERAKWRYVLRQIADQL